MSEAGDQSRDSGTGRRRHYHPDQKDYATILQPSEETGGERTLRSGEKATVPLETLHNFRNPTGEPTTFLVELRPGSEGFEKALKASYGLASEGRNPLYHPYYLAVLLGWGDMRLPGVFTVAEPLLRQLAKRARRKGIDRELEAKYCLLERRSRILPPRPLWAAACRYGFMTPRTRAASFRTLRPSPPVAISALRITAWRSSSARRSGRRGKPFGTRSFGS
jgi:hypothetical protein